MKKNILHQTLEIFNPNMNLQSGTKVLEVVEGEVRGVMQ